MRFRYYIVDADDGQVYGTDDDDVALASADCENRFVINAKSGEQLMYDGESADICEE